jgi:hypothetical protein
MHSSSGLSGSLLQDPVLLLLQGAGEGLFLPLENWSRLPIAIFNLHALYLERRFLATRDPSWKAALSNRDVFW